MGELFFLPPPELKGVFEGLLAEEDLEPRYRKTVERILKKLE